MARHLEAVRHRRPLVEFSTTGEISVYDAICCSTQLWPELRDRGFPLSIAGQRHMLRITTTTDTPSRLRLQLEGRLVAHWVNELLLACGDLGGRAIELDVVGLSFADADGIAALRLLIGCGGQLQNSSPFISELLRETNHAPPESCP